MTPSLNHVNSIGSDVRLRKRGCRFQSRPFFRWRKQIGHMSGWSRGMCSAGSYCRSEMRKKNGDHEFRITGDGMAELKVPVNENDHVQGKEDAPVTLVEYGDYECPYCGRAYYVIKRVQDHFGDDLRFVFRNFPLVEVHPLAEPAAETAEFAGAHGRFWEMHDGIYENQDRLGIPLLFELATALG